MIKCIKLSFKTDKSTLDKLFECNRISALIWNDCLLISKNYALNNTYINNEGKTIKSWINKTELQKQLKNKYQLHSQCIQAVAHKYIFARDSIHKTKLKGISTSRYPYKQKKNYNTKWVDKAFTIYPNGILELSMGNGNPRPNPLKLKINMNILNGINISSIKEIELIYDRKLMLSISYEDGITPVLNNNTNMVGVDLGEIHSISAFCDNGQAFIITGRKIRSIHQLRNKKLKELQKLMSKCKKGSRQWKKYNHAKKYILSKSDKQLNDYIHKTTKEFINWCLENKVKTIVIGNPEGVERNTKKHKKANRNNRQKLSNWSFGKIKQQLSYKTISYDIEIVDQEESYTTQTCPVCGRKNKTKSRNYKCRCGYKAHRDIHSANNILSKYINKGKMYIINNIQEIKYLRIGDNNIYKILST